MRPRQPSGGGSLPERLLGAALCVVAATLLLQWAIGIIEAIAVPLVIIIGLVLVVVGMASWWFRDRGPW